MRKVKVYLKDQTTWDATLEDEEAALFIQNLASAIDKKAPFVVNTTASGEATVFNANHVLLAYSKKLENT